MDLGISGRTAIVNAASKGLGKACAMSLAREGASVVISARNGEVLEAAAHEIRTETGGNVVTVVADVVTPEGRDAVLSACPNPDILVNNCGGPPPGDFHDWTRDDWLKALDANMLSAIDLITRTVDGMAERGFGRIVNITSVTVKAPIAILGLSNAARAGLTGFVAGVSRQMAKHNVIINNLLPGLFGTDRVMAPARAVSEKTGQDMDEVMEAMVREIPVGRMGIPAEFGEMCAFLCSQHAGYIVGQNILMDGGQTNMTI